MPGTPPWRVRPLRRAPYWNHPAHPDFSHTDFRSLGVPVFSVLKGNESILCATALFLAFRGTSCNALQKMLWGIDFSSKLGRHK